MELYIAALQRLEETATVLSTRIGGKLPQRTNSINPCSNAGASPAYIGKATEHKPLHRTDMATVAPTRIEKILPQRNSAVHLPCGAERNGLGRHEKQ